MSTVHKSDVKSVKVLLGLFGYVEERKKIKRLAKKNPKLFRSVLKKADDYSPVNFQSRTTKIFLFLEGNGSDLQVLSELEELRLLKAAGKELKKAVTHLSLVHDLEGSAEERLYKLITHEPVSRLEYISNMEPVKFCHCVLLHDSTEKAFAPSNQAGLDAILGDFGWRCVFACLSHENDSDVLKKRILSLDKRIREFLGSDPIPVVPPPKEKVLKRKVPVEEEVPQVEVVKKVEKEEERKSVCEFTTFAEGLEWFSKINLNNFVVSQ